MTVDRADVAGHPDPAALLIDRAPQVRWAARVVDVSDGTVYCDLDAATPRSIASVGKVLVLDEVARRLVEGTLDPALLLDRNDEVRVADSGLWQHLGVDALSVMDLAVLVAAVSDNLATNVLLRHLTPRAPMAGSSSRAGDALLSADGIVVHDRVRDRRGPGDPPRFASGSMAALTRWATRQAIGAGHGAADGPAAGSRTSGPAAVLVETWLRRNTDRSMVSSAFFQDPLAPDGETLVVTKTGTDTDVRCEAGYVARAGRALAFAVCAELPVSAVPGDAPKRAASPEVPAALEAMHGFGVWLDATLTNLTGTFTSFTSASAAG